MNWLLRLFDLFQETAKEIAGYLPQSGGDLIRLFQQVSLLASSLNIWINDNVGINLQAILALFGRLVIFALTFLLDLLKQLVGRL